MVLFLNNLHSALVTYPLTVQGATSTADRFRWLTRRALTLSLVLTPVLALGLLYPVVSLGVRSMLPWVAGALLFWQAQETLRRAMLSRLQHARALPGDALSYLGQAAAVFLLAHFKILTPAVAFGAVAATSAMAVLLQAVQLRAAPLGLSHVRSAAAESWRLGRWMVLTNVVNVGIVYITPWMLSAIHGPGEMARYQALLNILNVSNPIVMSTCSLIIPAVAASRMAALAEGRDTRAAVGKAVWGYALQGGGLLLPYYALLLAFPGLVLGIFYPHSPYLALTTELRLYTLVYGAYFIGHLCAAVLNGLEQTRWTFLATVVGAGANMLLCVPFAVAFGLKGAAWAALLPTLIQVTLAMTLLRRAWRAAPVPRPGPPVPGLAGNPVENELNQ